MDPARMFKESLTSRPELENSQGQIRKSGRATGQSALPLKNRRRQPGLSGPKVPKPDIRIPSSDRVKAAAETLVGDGHHRRRVLWER
jgi:hypothetical protein